MSQLPIQHGPIAAHITSAILAKAGGFWTISHLGKSFLIKDIKGLGYIQRLLRSPNTEFHSMDLLSGGTANKDPDEIHAVLESHSVTVGRAGDAGAMLDENAKQQYRRRLLELREELADAQRLGQAERAAAADSEIEFLAREISRAVGLGGRERRAGSASERARLNVTRAIKAALEKIAQHDPSLATILNRDISTGIFCCYSPELDGQISWRFSLDSSVALQLAVTETGPLLVKNAPAIAAMLKERTAFVGRVEESAALDLLLKSACEGEPKFAMITGPVGVGKTRVVTEFCANASRHGILTLFGNCLDRAESVPYLPFVEVLEAAYNQATDAETFRKALGTEAAEIARLMPQLRRTFPDIPAPLEVPPQQSRRVLYAAITDLIARTARQNPTVLVLEDLHWADDGTASLLAHLARSIPKVPLLIIGTYRDNEVGPDALLSGSLEQLTRLHQLGRVGLSGLSESAVGTMICDLSGHNPPRGLVQLIHSSTQGNPLFVEELVRHLLEKGSLIDSNGNFTEKFQLSDLDVPESLRLVIGRRLALLRSETQKILAIAAVIGRSFTLELLESASGVDADHLLDSLEETERAGLISYAVKGREAYFQFSHELIRQVVLGGLSLPRRQRNHLRVVSAIEKLYSNTIEDHASDLVHHLSNAGAAADLDKTLRYLAMAGRRAIEQSAFNSAVSYLNDALDLVQQRPDTPERLRTELDIQIDYGLAILATKGWYAPECGNAYKRALQLCRKIGSEDRRLFAVLSGLANFHLHLPELQLSRLCGEEMMQIAQAVGDDEMFVQAHWVVGRSLFYSGDLLGAHASFDQCIQIYDPQIHRSLSFQSGMVPGVLARIFDAMALWTLGYPDQAEKRAQDSVAISRSLESPFTLVSCLCMMAKYDSIRHDFFRAGAAIQEGLELANEHEFAYFQESLIFYLTVRLASLKRTDELRQVTRQSPRVSEVGYQVSQTWARSYLAEALGALGRIDTAFALVTQAAELVERNEERYAAPEVQRIFGELKLRQIASGSLVDADLRAADSAAEQSFRSAIEAARQQHQKSFELRACLSLSRILMRTNRADEARKLLTEIYCWFTEGFNMPEMKAAKAMLEELGHP